MLRLKKMEKFKLKIRKGRLELKMGLLGTENLQKAVQVEEITTWNELEDSESKCLQEAKIVENDNL